MHRLCILGSLDEFTALVKLAKARGFWTLVCDGYPDGPAKKEADLAFDIDVRNIDEIAVLCQREQIDGIITSFSDLLFECMVKIAAKAGLPCYMQPAQLPFYRDKYSMKQLLRSLRIDTPRFVCLERDFSPAALQDFSFPIVAKPLDKYGSRGLCVLHSPGELRETFDKICETSDVKKILAEEYHPGFEFNLMGWVHRGEFHVLSLADREKSPVGSSYIPISSRNVYPSRLIDEVLPPAAAILQKYARATRQQEGPLSMQFFWRPGEAPSVCEIAGRFFGYEHELVEISGGPSMEKLLLDAVYDIPALTKTLQTLQPHFPKVSATLYFHGREAIIQNQEKAKELLRLPGVLGEGTRLFYQEGETVTQFGKNPYVARYYIAGDSREEVDTLTQKIFSEISITGADGQEILYPNRIPDYSLRSPAASLQS